MNKWLSIASEFINRLPVERLLARPPDNKKQLQELQDILGGSQPHTTQDDQPHTEEQSIHQLANESRGRVDIATGCIPCAIGHFATCAGLLNEAMRFAYKDGLESNEVLDRINKCLDELNAMERVDLDAEKIYALRREEKGLAIKALNASRATRHALESLNTVDDLERVTADVQTIRKDIGRDWYRYRLSKVQKGEITEEEIEAEISGESQG